MEEKNDFLVLVADKSDIPPGLQERSIALESDEGLLFIGFDEPESSKVVALKGKGLFFAIGASEYDTRSGTVVIKKRHRGFPLACPEDDFSEKMPERADIFRNNVGFLLIGAEESDLLPALREKAVKVEDYHLERFSSSVQYKILKIKSPEKLTHAGSTSEEHKGLVDRL